jgi:hypothetical protein
MVLGIIIVIIATVAIALIIVKLIKNPNKADYFGRTNHCISCGCKTNSLICPTCKKNSESLR